MSSPIVGKAMTIMRVAGGFMKPVSPASDPVASPLNVTMPPHANPRIWTTGAHFECPRSIARRAQMARQSGLERIFATCFSVRVGTAVQFPANMRLRGLTV